MALTLFDAFVELFAEFFGRQRLSDRVHVSDQLVVRLSVAFSRRRKLSGLLSVRTHLLLLRLCHFKCGN